MKNVFTAIGAIGVILAILVGAYIGSLISHIHDQDDQSKAFVDRNVPLILSTWDEESLLKQASSDFISANSKDDLGKEFTGLSHKLGKMQAYQGSNGRSNTYFSLRGKELVIADYQAKVIFAKGPADISLTLVKNGDAWQIQRFNLTSPALLKD
jgi:hypothetical protein